ncbi:MAG: hypothetical protein Kow0090_01110 [Myxococcota bacterium]
MKNRVEKLFLAVLFFCLVAGSPFGCQKESGSGGEAKTPDKTIIAKKELKAPEKAAEPPAAPVAQAASSPVEAFNRTTLIRASVGNGEGQIGVFAGANEEKERVPQALALTGDGGIAVIDNENDRVLKFDKEGKFSGVLVAKEARRWFDITELLDGKLVAFDVQKSSLVFVNDTGGIEKSVILPPKLRNFSGFYASKTALVLRVTDRSYKITDIGDLKEGAIEKKHIVSLNALPTSQSDKYITARKTKTGEKEIGLVEIFEGDNAKEPSFSFEVQPPLEKALLGSVTYLGGDKEGDIFVRIEMLVGEQPIEVKRYVRRYTKEGKENGTIEIPSDTLGAPLSDIRIGADGAVFALLPYKDRVEVIKWTPVK